MNALSSQAKIGYPLTKWFLACDSILDISLARYML